jgi:hypothetical protein
VNLIEQILQPGVMPGVVSERQNINRRRPMAINSIIPDQIGSFHSQGFKKQSKMSRRVIIPLILSMFLVPVLTLLTPTPLLQQQARAQGITTGSISGTVADATGAVIPGATITSDCDGYEYRVEIGLWK